jgi:hypothetical protein
MEAPLIEKDNQNEIDEIVYKHDAFKTSDIPALSNAIEHTPFDDDASLFVMSTPGQSVVQVAPAAADAAANISQCNSLTQAEGSSESCNFRSAVAYCDAALRNASDHDCTIMLPPSEEIIMNAAFGEIRLQNVPPGVMRIEGNGSVISPPVAAEPFNQSCRLLNIQNGPLNTDFRLLLSNVTIARFGYWTLDGGAVSVTNVALNTDTVRFVHNIGSHGGAVAIDNSQDVSFLSTDFEFNRAANDGEHKDCGPSCSFDNVAYL